MKIISNPSFNRAVVAVSWEGTLIIMDEQNRLCIINSKTRVSKTIHDYTDFDAFLQRHPTAKPLYRGDKLEIQL